ncbi:MAG: hypothetical protein AB7O62_14200 [Pirellulales bacterium]
MPNSFTDRSYPASTVALAGACLAGLGLLVGMALDRIVTGNVDTNQASVEVPDEASVKIAQPGHDGPGLGLSRDRLQAALDSPVEPRFRYEAITPDDGLERCFGRLSGDRVFVELQGPAESLSWACLTMQLVPRRVVRAKETDETPPPTYEVPESLYMLLLANALAPGWNDSGRWIEGALADAAGGTPATVSQNGVRFTLARLDKFGVLTFSAEAE